MITRLKGIVEDARASSIVLMTSGGVGYEIYVSHLVADGVSAGQEIDIHTYLRVSEHVMELFGFLSEEERTFFSLLLSVSGVGPKSAMNILSLGSIDNIQDAILRKDVSYLTAVQGMGKKTAERLVVELKSKINQPSGQAGKQKSTDRTKRVGDVLSEVIDGLVAMGYRKEEARAVAEALDPKEKSTEELLREALRSLSR